MGFSKSEIARGLSKHRSSIYRELKRSTEPNGYFPKVAQIKMLERAKQKRLSKLQTNGVLRDHIVRSLKKGWGPEQISGRMKYQKLTFYACHESIYQFVYRAKSKELYHCLAYKQPKRKKRYSRHKQQCRYGDFRLITERPKEIGKRERFGHWEGDTIQFKGIKEKVVTTLVERKSRLVFLIKNERKYSRGVMKKIKKNLNRCLARCVKASPLIKAVNSLITSSLSST
ncbi:MAG TPA: IS30 family transposase [Gammaproteobacteria bacterium]|nr:IS30 family transposase [Gammaproteobacteria bacterium]